MRQKYFKPESSVIGCNNLIRFYMIPLFIIEKKATLTILPDCKKTQMQAAGMSLIRNDY